MISVCSHSLTLDQGEVASVLGLRALDSSIDTRDYTEGSAGGTAVERVRPEPRAPARIQVRHYGFDEAKLSEQSQHNSTSLHVTD